MNSPWKKIWGPVGMVLFRRGGSFETWATKGTAQNPTGNIHVYRSRSGDWEKVGGPGKMFAVGPANNTQPNLVGLSPDGASVWLMEYVGEGSYPNLTWTKICGPAGKIYAGGYGIFATNPQTGDLYKYSGTPMKWTKIAGPGKMFAIGTNTLNSLSTDGSGVWRYDGTPMKWTKIGGPAGKIYAGGSKLYATNPQSGDIYQYNEIPLQWTKIGGPGKMFVATEVTQLFGLSPDGRSVWRYDGTPMKWTKIGGAVGKIYAGAHRLCATDPSTNELWTYDP